MTRISQQECRGILENNSKKPPDFPQTETAEDQAAFCVYRYCEQLLFISTFQRWYKAIFQIRPIQDKGQ